MNQPRRFCPDCGTPAEPAIKFCGNCGRDLGPVPAVPRGKPANKTVFGVAAASVPQPAAPPPAKAAPQAASEKPREPAPGPQPAAPAKRGKVPNRTMLGVPAASVGAGAQPPASPAETPAPAPEAPEAGGPAATSAAAPPSAPSGGKVQNRTMFGMPAASAAGMVGTPPPADATPPLGAPPSEQAAASAPAVSPSSVGPSNRTVLGIAGPAPGAQPEASPGGPRAAVQAAPSARAVPVAGDASLSDDMAAAGLGRRRKARSPVAGKLVLVGLAGFLGFVLLAGLAVYLVLRGGAPDAQASVVHAAQGEALLVEVPAAPAGARVRFAGTEKPLEAGRAQFPLEPDALHLGDNALELYIVDQDGEATELPLTITLDFRVYADLSRLGADRAGVVIVVQAKPGSRVTLADGTLALDPSGHGRRLFPVEPSVPEGPNPVFEHTVKYTITPPGGEAVGGEVKTRIPYTTLQIDRPGKRVITDQPAIEIAGAVHSSAEVSIGGAPVEVKDGRFLHRYALPENRTYEVEVVARQPDRVPRREALQIRKVADLVAEAESFPADPELTYAKIEQNPNIYKGRKVAFTGRVYNVQVSGGQGVIQMLVKDCARGQQCPLWVTYAAAVDVTANQWVKVLGEVAGEQQFRARSDRIVSVPRVDAAFVLSAER